MQTEIKSYQWQTAWPAKYKICNNNMFFYFFFLFSHKAAGTQPIIYFQRDNKIDRGSCDFQLVSCTPSLSNLFLNSKVSELWQLVRDWEKFPFSSSLHRTTTTTKLAPLEKFCFIQNWLARAASPPTCFLPPAKIVWDDPVCHVTPSRASPVRLLRENCAR